MKRKVFFICILLIVVVTLTSGCKKKIEDKISEKIIEKATGGKVDINKDSTTITIGEDTTKLGENLKWPKDKMGNLRELKANINAIMEDEEKTLCIVSFSDLKNSDAQKYVESIKELNYKEIFLTSIDDGFVYSGQDEDGSEVIFSFNKDGSGSLSYTDKPFMIEGNYNEENLDENYSVEDNSFADPTRDLAGETDENVGVDIDMTDDASWPKDFLKDIPELEGKITLVSSDSPRDKYVYLEYVTKEDALEFLEKLKEAGFIEAPSEFMADDYFNFQANNSNGDLVTFAWTYTGSTTISMIRGN